MSAAFGATNQGVSTKKKHENRPVPASQAELEQVHGGGIGSGGGVFGSRLSFVPEPTFELALMGTQIGNPGGSSLL